MTSLSDEIKDAVGSAIDRVMELPRGSRWTITIDREKSGEFSVHFVISVSSEGTLTLNFSDEPQYTYRGEQDGSSLNQNAGSGGNAHREPLSNI